MNFPATLREMVATMAFRRAAEGLSSRHDPKGAAKERAALGVLAGEQTVHGLSELAYGSLVSGRTVVGRDSENRWRAYGLLLADGAAPVVKTAPAWGSPATGGGSWETTLEMFAIEVLPTEKSWVLVHGGPPDPGPRRRVAELMATEDAAIMLETGTRRDDVRENVLGWTGGLRQGVPDPSPAEWVEKYGGSRLIERAQFFMNRLAFGETVFDCSTRTEFTEFPGGAFLARGGPEAYMSGRTETYTAAQMAMILLRYAAVPQTACAGRFPEWRT
jgi:hypothetical protein